MPDVLKYVPINDIVLDIITNSYINSEQPDPWKISNIVPVPKYGDLTKADNYRGISLTSIMAKTYVLYSIEYVRYSILYLDPIKMDSDIREQQ